MGVGIDLGVHTLAPTTTPMAGSIPASTWPISSSWWAWRSPWRASLHTASAARSGRRRRRSTKGVLAMPFGDFVNQIPAPIFLLIHLTAFLIGAFFAWRSFSVGASLLGWAFSLFALAEISYMTYHLDWTGLPLRPHGERGPRSAGLHPRVRRGDPDRRQGRPRPPAARDPNLGPERGGGPRTRRRHRARGCAADAGSGTPVPTDQSTCLARIASPRRHHGSRRHDGHAGRTTTSSRTPSSSRRPRPNVVVKPGETTEHTFGAGHLPVHLLVPPQRHDRDRRRHRRLTRSPRSPECPSYSFDRSPRWRSPRSSPARLSPVAVPRPWNCRRRGGRGRRRCRARQLQ